MNFLCKALFVILAIGSSFLYKGYKDNVALVPAPQFDSNYYWGPGDKSAYKENVAIKPIKISYDVTVSTF